MEKLIPWTKIIFFFFKVNVIKFKYSSLKTHLLVNFRSLLNSFDIMVFLSALAIKLLLFNYTDLLKTSLIWARFFNTGCK